MSRPYRKPNDKGRPPPRDSGKKPSAKQEPSGNNSYEELFPALGASTTVKSTKIPEVQTQNEPLLPDRETQDSVEPCAKKKPTVWKPLSNPSTTSLSYEFMAEPEKEKVNNRTSDKYSSTGRSASQNHTEAQSETRSMSKWEEEIDTKVRELIATIHLRKEFVSAERLEQELFAHYKVKSFRELRVEARNVKTLANHIHRIKDVTFYMQVFKQIFNLCTLHDLAPLLARFLKVGSYEDAHLGPLDEHPDVKQVFQYKPKRRYQPIPTLTSGDVIDAFRIFKEKHRQRRFDYEQFLDELVEQNQLQRREELGIFCRSFPYLSEVTGKVSQDCTRHQRQATSDAQRRITSAVETRLWEIQREVQSELEPSLYTNKSPIEVLDHLVSIVDQHLADIQQKNVRDILMKIRNNDLLRCLLNVSIYLGNIDQPDKFIAELKKLTDNQTERTDMQSATSLSQTSKSKKKNSQKRTEEVTTSPELTIETSFQTISSASYKPPVSLQKLCSDLFKVLARYDTILTIKQLSDVKKHVCKEYSIKNFSELGIKDENDDENSIPLDMISFFQNYRNKIDPAGELSIYESSSSTGDRQEIYSFVNQLAMLNSWRDKQQQDGYAESREIPLSKDQISAVEKGLQHKFGGQVGNQGVSQLIKKAKNYAYRRANSIIHFEESLLDEVSLNRLGISPASLLVDESNVCQIILQCPILDDLSTWLQWPLFFHSRYGPLRTFLARKEQKLGHLLLLETSNGELLRLPWESSPEQFQKELLAGNIRSSVGHLCALIVTEYIQVNQVPLTIYRQIMSTWFIALRSAAQLQRDHKEPMQYVLEFLTYLPALIGQCRIVRELVLEPLDVVFVNDDENEAENVRDKIWTLARGKQKSILEMWGYMLDIDEWKNEKKWRGIPTVEKEPQIHEPKQPTYAPQDQSFHIETPTVSDTVATPLVVERAVSMNSTINMDENSSSYVAFEHIKKIREGFGIDSTLDEAGRSIVNNLQGMIERSLDKLSNDLYSEQGHFVLELIQNADDNRYASDRVPTLRFVVSQDRILVCNNEIGFQKNNIEAICNVGKSTKGKHKQGYTGHKGIGFKSVFMVSHRPEIHSGDYHFCFDTMNGSDQIGYIRPVWLEKSDEILPSSDEWTTCIRLPVKEEKRGEQLKRNFNDIHARLLLFLNRLRQIEVIRQKGNNESESQIYTRIDHANGQIIELQKKTSTSTSVTKQFWLVVKTEVYVPSNVKMQLNDVKCQVESSIIAIAYPLDAIHQSSSHGALTAQPVFAYLPVRSYGFRFILQGDFEITATRQDIAQDNAWNDWLKRDMVKLLPVACEAFQNLPDLLSLCSSDVREHLGSVNLIETLKYFIKMLPTRNETDPYFNSFIEKSVQNLMGFIKLPVLRNDDPEWVSPSQCVIVKDSFIREIFSQELLLSHFNSYYLNEKFVNECDQSILLRLGCRQLDFADILRLIRTLYTQNEQEHSTKTTSIEQIAQWFLCIDYSLQQEREKPGFNLDQNDQSETTTIEQLKEMKIIPLKDQTRLVSIAEYHDRAILFPIDKSVPYAKHLKIVLEDLPTVDEKILDYIEKKYPRRLESIKRLLADLGISDSRRVGRIYSNHILPIMSDDTQWSTKSDAVLIAYLVFIFKELYCLQLDQFAHEMEKLKNRLIVKTHQGKFVRIDYDKKNIVHLPSLYGSKKSLDSLKFAKDRFLFLSDDYYNQHRKELFQSESERQKLIDFLNELHIQDFFLVSRIDNGFIRAEQLVDTQWSDIIGSLSARIFEPFIIQDYRCEEFDAFVTSKEHMDSDQYNQLLVYLDYCHQYVSHYYAASIVRARGRNSGSAAGPIQGVESSFYFSLRKHSWIPVAEGQFFKPTDVYFLSPNNPFRRYLPCLDNIKAPLKDRNFIQLLGFRVEVTPMTMFELLMKWACNFDRDSLRDLINTNHQIIPYNNSLTSRQSCRDTIGNMRTIYKLLASNDETCNLLARFRQWPLVFVPRSHELGEFLFAHQVFWKDFELLLDTAETTKIDSIQRFAIHSFYEDNSAFFERFFTEIFQIQRGPTLDDYLPLLSNTENKTTEDIWKCIVVIVRIAFEQNKQATVQDKCIDWAFLPCLGKERKFVKYPDQPYFPHDTNIANLFADIVSIIDLPDELMRSDEFKQKFCSLFNIPDLGDVVQVLVDVKNEQPALELLDFYEHTIDLIQYFLLHHEFLSENRSKYLETIFSEMTFIAVESIDLSYQYKDGTVRGSSSSTVLDCFIDESKRRFYILQKYTKSESRHIDTIVNYLIRDEVNRLKLSYYIRSLFKMYQDDGIAALDKERESLAELNVAKWSIPSIVKKEETPEISEDEEEEEMENHVSDDALAEMMAKMENEPAWQLPPPSLRDPNQTEVLTSFPSTAKQSIFNVPVKSEVSTPTNASTSVLVPSTNNADDEQAVANETDKHIVRSEISSNREKNSSEASHTTPLTIADFASTEPKIDFEQVRVSDFADLVLSPTAPANPPLSSNVNLSDNQNDSNVGHRGEEFVYRYLRSKYPDAKIEWMNEHQEFGHPFDIQLIRKGTKNQRDLIEVKTTRIPTQNTFQISVGEVECLLSNSENYYIYRVYLAHDLQSSVLTILSKIKCHLQQKQLALSITIPEKYH